MSTRGLVTLNDVSVARIYLLLYIDMFLELIQHLGTATVRTEASKLDPDRSSS